MKTIKENLHIIILSVVLCFLLTVYLIITEELADKYNEKVGTEFILDEDTLMIIDYSSFNGTFTLSNGLDVSHKLVINNEK